MSETNDPINDSVDAPLGGKDRAAANTALLRQAILAQTLGVIRGHRRRERWTMAAGLLGCYLAGIATVAIGLPSIRNAPVDHDESKIAAAPGPTILSHSSAEFSDGNTAQNQQLFPASRSRMATLRWSAGGDEPLAAGDAALPPDFWLRGHVGGRPGNSSAGGVETADASLTNYHVLQRLLKDVRGGDETSALPNSPSTHSTENPS
jgi:hypothetical protein